MASRREASRGRDRELCLRHHVGATVLAFQVGKGGKFVGLPRRWIVNGIETLLPRSPSSSYSEFPFPSPPRFSFLLHIRAPLHSLARIIYKLSTACLLSLDEWWKREILIHGQFRVSSSSSDSWKSDEKIGFSLLGEEDRDCWINFEQFLFWKSC